MKMRHLTCGFALGLIVAITAGTVRFQDAPPGMDAQAMAMVKSMKAAHNNPTAPSEFHKKLDHFIGDWDVTARVWMMGPDEAPLESTGTAGIKWIYGQRFTIETMEANMDMGGMKIPLDSMIITGYDNYRNQYVGTMCGAMNTELINFQGGVTPDGSTFTYYGTMHEPMLNVTGRLVRFTTTIVDEDNHTVSVYDLHAGEDYKVLEFAYRRR